MNNKIGIYIKSILLPVIVGGIVGLIISRFIDYNSLEKPFLAPPSIVFPIVWTILYILMGMKKRAYLGMTLYILMGISYGRLKSKELTDEKTNIIYYVQLGINALWSIFFFVLKWRLFSFFWIILLDIAVILMIINFYKKDKVAGLLQIPYLLWSLFATYLNLGIYLLNR